MPLSKLPEAAYFQNAIGADDSKDEAYVEELDGCHLAVSDLIMKDRLSVLVED